ncbi:flagellar basal body P-ring formation chaperone FlgA [Tatumella citrea]|uniref:Flagella basal body P-ring formation protein FlgA n=1 Tax=Tatumella citrea TaxID=53336 RepID=A0A1Y0LHS2_TATCI|nr:flagellar basal body P-ring formation chaperone FlgA [Tatumella citrea]ARU93625.1 flagella basal body P-ring formation protein FlgA [Tatumella citrea]ARU97663.1 flagella basal body P-ring formation protein FlgA [Tatumella citrea]
MKKCLFLQLLIPAFFAHADSLSQQLNTYFAGRDPQYAAGMQVIVRTPEPQWPHCTQPVFSLPGNSQRWGRMTIAARCGQRRHFLQIELRVTGKYYVSAQAISRGGLVNRQMLSVRSGRLDTLPARTLLFPETLLPAIALQSVPPGKVIISSLFRQPWQVKSGDNVQIELSGEGFSASAAGTALNNAAAGGEVRVRTENGQIVNALVDVHGKLRVKIN